jgi:hypothetical protein
VIELADAIRVQTDDFTIENRVLSWQLPESDPQEKKVEMFLIAGDQLAFAVFNVGDCAAAVVLQLEDVIRVVEWFGNTLEAHKLDAGEQARTSLAG